MDTRERFEDCTDQVDAWSDHDFYLVVKQGREEHFRTLLDWLPDQDDIAFWARETQHGPKVVHSSGAVLEFAEDQPDDHTDFRIFLALLVIGLGRAARGEELVAGELIRVYAVLRLTTLLRRHTEPEGAAPADPYNPLRRSWRRTRTSAEPSATRSRSRQPSAVGRCSSLPTPS